MSDNKIIININEANKAQKYSKEGLFQIESFNKVKEILQEHNVGNDTKNIVDCRFHDTIFIDGARGVGKTAFMLNIKEFYKKKNKEKDKKDKKNYLFLDPVDPTLLEHTEKFLSVVLARVVEKVSDKIDSVNEDKSRKYFEALSNLSKSLSAIKTLSGDIGIEEIASNKSSLKLEQYAHEFFQVVSEMYEVKGIVILIDDIDMAFDKGFDVLEVVRKYLASPYLIPIVAGDMKLYKEIVETQFMKKIGFHDDVKYLQSICSKDKPLKDSKEYKAKRDLLDNLVEQYLHKLFPSEYHIELKDIFSILENSEVEIRFGNNLKVSYSDLKDFEIRHINFGINQVEFTFNVFVNNARELVQYIYAKKKIYKKFFKKSSIDFTYKKYNVSHIIDTMDVAIKSFIKEPEYKESLAITALKYKIKKEKFQELSKLTQNDVSSFENKEYNIYKALTNEFFKNSKLSLEQKSDNLVISNKNLKEFTKKESDYNDEEKYIASLFIFNDYYTQHQTKNFLFAGKFIEMLIYSLSITQDIDLLEVEEQLTNMINNESFDDLLKNKDYEVFNVIYDADSKDIENESNIELSNYFNMIEIEDTKKELQKIVIKIPFNSLFTENKRYLSDENSANDEDEVSLSFDTKEIYRDIIIWKNVFVSNNLKLNSPLIYEILHKFFNNYNAIKSLKLQDTPLEFMQRTVLIFINAVAYFENSDLDVANTNMAVNKDFNLINILIKTNASTKNIKPMFNKKGSLTKALFYHPLISHILFPDKDSSLKVLEFPKQKQSKQNLHEACNQELKELGFKASINITETRQLLEKLNELFINNPTKLDEFRDCKNFISLITRESSTQSLIKLQKYFKEKFNLNA